MRKYEIRQATDNGQTLAYRYFSGEIFQVRILGPGTRKGYWKAERVDGRYLYGPIHSHTLISTWDEYAQSYRHQKEQRHQKYRDYAERHGHTLTTNRIDVQESEDGAWVEVKIWVPASEIDKQ